MSYNTATEFRTYISETKMDSDILTTLEDTLLTKALNISYKSIECLPFRGEKTSVEQTDEFPRDGDTEVPQDIINAECELAFEIIKGRDAEKEFKNLTVTSVRFGPASTSFTEKGNDKAHIAAGIVSINAWKLVLPYLGGIKSFKILRS